MRKPGHKTNSDTVRVKSELHYTLKATRDSDELSATHEYVCCVCTSLRVNSHKLELVDWGRADPRWYRRRVDVANIAKR